VTTLPDEVTVGPAVRLHGTVTMPGDKSASHRALLLAAYADGRSTIHGLSDGEDVAATARSIQALGADVEVAGGTMTVIGGRDDLRAAPMPLDCGNSGTGMRLLMGFVAGIPGRHELVGDASLSSRPMDRVALPLEMMGATVAGSGSTCRAPLVVEGGPLRGIEYVVPVPSAQVKSAILLAGLWATTPTTVIETTPTRPTTEEMIPLAGGAVDVVEDPRGTAITVTPGPLTARAWRVPGDPSQAAFFVVAGLLAAEGGVTCQALYGDQTRVGFLDVLRRMGGTIERRVRPDGLLDVRATPSQLRATTIDAAEIPSLDEVPILVVAAAAAEGTTRFVGVDELRIKESDRFARSLALATALGATARGEGDDLVVEGIGSARQFAPVDFEAVEDHRMAMSAAVGALVGNGGRVRGFSTVASSFPTFLEVLEALQ
jgi:3-phosphoshikimate 1-carboxyvinyltransferase